MSTANTLTPSSDDAADIVHMINKIRGWVVLALARYIELSATMREFEDTFSAQVLHTAQQLHDVIEERRRLEAEWQRIQKKIDHDEYRNPNEIGDDIRAVLAAADAEGPYEPAAAAEHPRAVDDGLDPVTKERILREFKRIVLPNVHTDTSDTPYSIFEVAYSAYRSGDYTLMEAFIIQYRGEATLSGDDGRMLTRDQLTTRLSEYRAAARRLDGRCQALQQSVTDDEIRDPERTRERMKRQQEEFWRAIVAEAERLQELRARLETLAERGAT